MVDVECVSVIIEEDDGLVDAGDVCNKGGAVRNLVGVRRLSIAARWVEYAK
jgi:hypothetical protein